MYSLQIPTMQLQDSYHKAVAEEIILLRCSLMYVCSNEVTSIGTSSSMIQWAAHRAAHVVDVDNLKQLLG
jgi:hypothetical protein